MIPPHTKVLIWDLPTRLFHLLLGGGFIFAFSVAQFGGEHSPLFPFHAIAGLTIALLVLLRIFWGFAGTRYARFSSFATGPAALIAYMKGVFTGRGERHIGHNPGSAAGIFLMLTLVLLMATTGLAMSWKVPNAKDVHEILAYTLAAVVAIHILGVVIHTFRFRENIAGSMISGRKRADPSLAITTLAPAAALVMLLHAGTLAGTLYANWNPATGRTSLPLIGTSIKLGGEAEESDRPRGIRSDKDKD